MTAGPRGPTAGPLDLRAVEAQLKERAAGFMSEGWPPDESTEAALALLAHCRALTARLESSTHVLDGIAELAGDSVTRGLAALNRDRNRAVLRAARDGPA